MYHLEWNEDTRGFNPFADLFDRKCLSDKLSARQNGMKFEETQSLMLQCASIPVAKVTVDVAILTWLSEEIRSEASSTKRMVDVDAAMLGSVCAIGLDPANAKYL